MLRWKYDQSEKLQGGGVSEFSVFCLKMDLKLSRLFAPLIAYTLLTPQPATRVLHTVYFNLVQQ